MGILVMAGWLEPCEAGELATTESNVDPVK